MIRLTASDFNTLMTLYKQVRAEMPSGGTNTSYVAVGDVWVNVTPLSGNPLWYAQGLMPIASAKITMHYREDLKSGMQLVDTSTAITHVYRVLQPPMDVENRHIYSQLIAQELEVGIGVPS